MNKHMKSGSRQQYSVLLCKILVGTPYETYIQSGPTETTDYCLFVIGNKDAPTGRICFCRGYNFNLNLNLNWEGG